MLLLKDLLWSLDGCMDEVQTSYYYGYLLACYVALRGTNFVNCRMFAIMELYVPCSNVRMKRTMD